MWSLFKGLQGMSLNGNAAAAAAAAAAASDASNYAPTAASTASAAATSAATVADNAKMCASSIIFRGVKCCFYLISGATSPEPPPRK